jgi:hypothetical protein
MSVFFVENIADNYFGNFPKIPFANNTETLIFAFVVIHGVLTKIIYETEIHIYLEHKYIRRFCFLRHTWNLDNFSVTTSKKRNVREQSWAFSFVVTGSRGPQVRIKRKFTMFFCCGLLNEEVTYL